MSKKEDLTNSRIHEKTGWFSEEERGRVDENGRIHGKTGWFSEDEVGRIDDDGRVYKKTGWFSEEETHRIDDDGRMYEKTGWFSEEEVGRIDDDGRVYKKTGWFSEEEVGRVEKKDDDGGCFLSSACIEARGLPDDCGELQTLRAFRASYVTALPEGPALLEEYRRVAPAIVARIRRSPDMLMVFGQIYSSLILPAVDLIGAGRHAEALCLYRAWVDRLRGEHL